MAGYQAGTLEALLDHGWEDHDKESERLARALEAAAEEEVAARFLVPFLHLSTHVVGEHLGDWRRALRLGKRALGGRTPVAETARAWGRLSVAAILAGDPVEAAALELSCLEVSGQDFGAALLDIRFMLVAALVGAGRTAEAARLYRGALDLARRIGQAQPLDRTIAIASNNLGWELYEATLRSGDDEALMRLCAETALEFWGKCGTWINVARAHYLAALTANITGDAVAGLASADAGLATIAMNGERPLDGALLQLARAVSLAALGDEEGSAQAFEEADASASALTASDLQAQFAAERAKARIAAGRGTSGATRRLSSNPQKS